MIKSLFAVSLYLQSFAVAPPETTWDYNKAKEETYVYICNSSGAKKYHFIKNCRGLNACKHEIKKVTLKEAKGTYKRTLCGWED